MLTRMTIDWTAEAERVVGGRRFGELDVPPARRDAPQAPLSEEDVCEAETELGITFPDEYRDHLLRNNAGGAVCRLRRSAAGWGWYGDASTNYGLLTTPFPHPDSYRDDQDELDDREPLEENFPDHAAYRSAWKNWDAEYEVFQERRTSGAVYIQENGCGFSTLLVVTGPHRGTIWFDGRATCDKIILLNLYNRPVSFAEWLGRSSMEMLVW